MTGEQYLDQLQALLPPGAAWQREKGATLTKFLQGFADELERVDVRGDQLIEEADPRTTLELLPEWERIAGLPDPCVGPGQTLGQRRAALLQRLTSVGGQSRAYFIAVALALGFEITIDEYRAHDCDDDCEYPILGQDWNFAWRVDAPLHTVGELTCEDTCDEPLAWWSNVPLECVINRLKPAHTVAIFAYLEPYLLLDGVGGTFASTPDSAANSIVGDIDLRARCAPDDYTPAVFSRLINKGTASAASCSYRLMISPAGLMQISVSDGATFFSSQSSVALPLIDAELIDLRGTLDINDGAGNRVANFYYKAIDAVVWTQLGSTQTTAGVATVADLAQVLAIGGTTDGAGMFAGKIYSAEVRNGIDGPIVAKFDAKDALSEDVTSFTSSTGEVWTLQGNAQLSH